MISYPSVCKVFDEKISLLDFKDQSLNALKDVVLELIFKTPDIRFKELKSDLTSKGFTIQLRKIMQSNIPQRLNLDKNHMEINYVHEVLRELLDLINIKSS